MSFFKAFSGLSSRLIKKKLKERQKKQTRLYVALHFNLFTPRTIYERFEGGNDPRS